MKGISPLVATVLLIGITVGIAGIVGFWISGFTTTATRTTTAQGQLQVLCSNAAIDVSNLKYCNNNVSGIIKNNGRITIGNVTLQVTFLNGTTVSSALNDTQGNFLALRPGQLSTFNQSIGASSSGQYDKLYVYTNCSGVTDIAASSDIVTC
ncbi:MAG: hypothetical protein HYW22_01515 [Candidatus Aenigmarchaeota archaeon]|nr:hypothetical protein [Candidatus Aenigmarchaeota archaeon]